MNSKYNKFFKKTKNEEVIYLTSKELKKLWFVYNERNWFFSYENKEKNLEIRYVIDILDFWRYRNWRTSEELYLYSIDDIKKMQKAIDEWFIYT